MEKNIKIKRIIFIILILINCSVIFYMSNQVADNSEIQSSRVVDIISEIIPTIKNMEEPDKSILKQEVLTPIVRKTAHFSIYALLGIFTFEFVKTFKDIVLKKKIMFSILFCFCYAITDEFHQTFIQGRSGEIRDVIIDTLGAFTGILIIIGITKICKKIIKNNRKEITINE